MRGIRDGETKDMMREVGLRAALIALALAGCTQEAAAAQAQTISTGDMVGVASVIDGDTI